MPCAPAGNGKRLARRGSQREQRDRIGEGQRLAGTAWGRTAVPVPVVHLVGAGKARQPGRGKDRRHLRRPGIGIAVIVDQTEIRSGGDVAAQRKVDVGAVGGGPAERSPLHRQLAVFTRAAGWAPASGWRLPAADTSGCLPVAGEWFAPAPQAHLALPRAAPAPRTGPRPAAQCRARRPAGRRTPKWCVELGC